MEWGMFGNSNGRIGDAHSQCADHEWKDQCVPSLVLGPQETPRGHGTIVALWGLWSWEEFSDGVAPMSQVHPGTTSYLCQGRFRKHLETPVSHTFPFLSAPNSQGERYKPADLPLAHWVPLQQMTQKSFHTWPCPKPVHWSRIHLLNKSQTGSIPEIKRSFGTQRALIMKWRLVPSQEDAIEGSTEGVGEAWGQPYWLAD